MSVVPQFEALRTLHQIDQILTQLTTDWIMHLVQLEEETDLRSHQGPAIAPSTSIQTAFKHLEAEAQSLNSRRAMARRFGCDVPDASLHDLLANRLLLPSVSTETKIWRLKTAMFDVEQLLRGHHESLDQIKDLLQERLAIWFVMYNTCVATALDEGFQQQVSQHEAKSVDDPAFEWRLLRYNNTLLKLCRSVAKMGRNIPRQMLITEFLSPTQMESDETR